MPGEEGMRSHLEECGMCREDLAELIEFVRFYRETLASADVGERFETLLGVIPPAVSAAEGGGTDRGVIELAFTPYREPFGAGARWAAATEPLPAREPLRFCSADGRYILREFLHPEGEQQPSSYYLVAEQGLKTEQIELEIDGRRCPTGPGGKLELQSAGCRITRDTRIIIRIDRRN